MGNYHCKSAPFPEARYLEKESIILESLRHCPQVIRELHHSIRRKGDQYIFNLYLERVSGGTLTERIEKSVGGHMQEADVRLYTKSLLLGLYEVHKTGIVHCDLRPENILLVSQDSHEVKIANFELAVKSGYTEQGYLASFPFFLSPEVVAQGLYCFSTDIWALGCCIVRMMTGKLPWNILMSSEDMLFKIGHTDELPEIPDNLSMQGKNFLRKCFVKDSSERWTAQMLLEHPFVTEEMEMRHVATTNQDKEEGLIQSYDYIKLKSL